MNFRRLISSGSWLVRKLCTAASENATAEAVEVAAPKRNRLYSRLSALRATITDWMEKRKMQFSHADHAIRLDLIAKTKGLGAAEDYLSALPPSAKNQ
ncbi:hypothetical protein CRYUN_Cryun23aG0110400 [Craigia yunnanensis]